ncbi:MAG: alkaline phosphatase family protein [Clostridiales bacterium]|jgi:2,3-bisphosphoglycerate-independent phosphoglycerate mutase|nr:alkaline phosphatase family protein [Eubacteriales bacterium]MDH7566084.1 alkaline phosphatase family protein [Clostridiales bacterium]
MKMIFLFIDGFGMGENDSRKNPLYAACAPNLDYMFKNFTVMPTDCTLGVPGLPQSATGQTAIFTGVNAPAVLGRHLNGQPTATLKKIICKNNLFKELIRRGLKVTNANVYMPKYLDKMLDPKERKHRPSVTTVMTMASGLSFRLVEDYDAGRGVYHDITGQIIVDNGYMSKAVTPREAARNLYNISREYDFTLFEHFLPDIIGHTMDMDLAVREIELLDAFVGELMKSMDMKEDILLMTSDHGNIEDLSVKTHTCNKVPTVMAGALPQSLTVKVESLLDIMPLVVEIFEKAG